jgi:outer membrane protein assembly factor BamD (BamD/ComL family)
MSRNRILLAGLVIPCLLFGQDIDEAIDLFNSFQFSRAKEIFQTLKNNKNHPRLGEIYYYLGRLSINPDSATYYYYNVINDYPQSRNADISYLEIAKINFARKNYRTTITNLNELIKRYPDSDYRDEIMFWMGVSHISLNQAEQGQEILAELQRNFPTSVWSERAANVTQKKDIEQEYFTVQLGSYRNKGNAEEYAATLRDKGLDVSVVEALVKGQVYYRVWTGNFLTVEQAKEYMLKLDTLGLKGNVVKGP